MKKKVLITGAAGAVGSALVQAYCAEGAEVIAVDKKRKDYTDCMYTPKYTYTIDLANTEEASAFISDLRQSNRLPTITIFCAAVHENDTHETINYDVFHAVMQCNMMSVVFLLSCLMPSVSPGATFVFCSSGVVVFPNPTRMGYYISKLAITRIFDLFRTRYYGRGLTFKTIVLGPLRSEMLEASANPHRWVHRLRDLTTGTVSELVSRVVPFIG